MSICNPRQTPPQRSASREARCSRRGQGKSSIRLYRPSSGTTWTMRRRALAALGTALSNQGKYDAAIAPLEQSVQLSPASWETHWTLAKAYYYHKQFPEALKASQQALTESNGKAPEIALLVAQSLSANGRYEECAQSLRDFLKNHADHSEAPTARRYLERLASAGKIRRE